MKSLVGGMGSLEQGVLGPLEGMVLVFGGGVLGPLGRRVLVLWGRGYWVFGGGYWVFGGGGIGYLREGVLAIGRGSRSEILGGRRLWGIYG